MIMVDTRQVIGQADLTAVLHWKEVHAERSDDSVPVWTDGSPMDRKRFMDWKAMLFPIPIPR